MIRRAFFPLEEYPELERVQRQWRMIRDEGQNLRHDMIWIEDGRTSGRVWAFAPLQPEEEDRNTYLDALSGVFRVRATKTVELIQTIPNVLGYGFSLLLAGCKIKTHVHTNPFVTAMLGLAVGNPCWITVGIETELLCPGSMLIFDYTLPHEITNESAEDRLVLLILLPNKTLCTYKKVLRSGTSSG